jgi:hypothetical protein
MNILRFITGESKKDKELKQRQDLLDVNIDKSTNLQEKVLELQKSNMEIAWKNEQLNEELIRLVAENDRTKNILLERENKIKATQDELDERSKEIRKEEITNTARKADTRVKEQLVVEELKKINVENKRILEREIEAEKVKKEAEIDKAKYEELSEELKIKNENIEKLEEDAKAKSEQADLKTANANTIFERAKLIDEEIKAKEAKFEEHRASIEKSLNEKIEEYDRRIEDLNAVKGIVDDLKFDDSEDGKKAKIVVKEAIRQAKKSLNEIHLKFEELDEKYASGTFKGFSTPLNEIDKEYDELKNQYNQIREHIQSQTNLPGSIIKWLELVEEAITNTDKLLKSWEFSEAYRNIIWGLATCKNYELLLTILNDFGGSDADENNEPEDATFTDWYEILEVEPNASAQDIKKAYRAMAKKYHPDKAPDELKDEYTAKMAMIIEAKCILCDENKRKEFDQIRNQYKQQKNK